jgi:hypothetical protein
MADRTASNTVADLKGSSQAPQCNRGYVYAPPAGFAANGLQLYWTAA